MPLNVNLPTNTVDGAGGHTAGHNVTNTAVNLTAAAVDTHAAAADPHADRAYAAMLADWIGGPLPHVVVNTTTGLDPTTTTTYLDATMTISGPQAYSGTTQIRGRGNTTWTDSDKKPWRLQLTTAAIILGMPTERSWFMLANAFDPLKIRNAVAFEIARRCTGLAWTPRTRMVELTMNGTYRGLYQLGEHVERGTDKINVGSAASGTSGLTLTGAYTLEIDRRYIDAGDIGFTTTLGVMVALDDPDGTVAQQKTYIQDWVQNFETVLMGSNWLDPTLGYAQYIDMPSWIDWYLVNELISNRDANEFSSIKMYKTRDATGVPGKLYLGPTWDHDNSLNNAFGATTSATGFTVLSAGPNGAPGFRWIDRMLDDPTFFATLAARWATLKTALTTGDSIFAFIDRLTDRLTYAVGRDKRRWSSSTDIIAQTDAMTAWLRTRMDWLGVRWVVDTTPPSIPTGLTATPGNTQVSLSWTASTDNVVVDHYIVRRGGTQVATPGGTTYLDTGRTNGVTYSYTVEAVDLAGNPSGQSGAQTATPAAGFSPDDVTGLRIWYQADALTLANNDPVATWTDSSGNSHNMFMNSAPNRPVFRTNIVNSLPVVRFTASAVHAMETTGVPGNSPQVTIFMVIRPTTVVGRATVVGAGASGNLGFGLTAGRPVMVKQGIADIGTAPVGNALGTTNFAVVTGVLDSTTSWAIYVNGAAAGSGSASVTFDGGGSRCLAGNTIFNSEPFDGDIAEVIEYTAALSTQDRQDVEAYLTAKWGL